MMRLQLVNLVLPIVMIAGKYVMKIINKVWEHDEIVASKPSSAHSDDCREISNEDNKQGMRT